MMSSDEGVRRFTSNHRGEGFLRRVFGYSFALVCLVWVFHDIHGERLFREVSAIRWGWVMIAVLLDILSYVAQASRWGLLLRPLGKLSPLKATQAVYAGLFTNEILPLRAGELVRAYLASRWLPATFVSVIPSMAVERLFDGIWLALGIGLTAMLVHLPRDLVRTADVLGAIVVAGTGLFAYVVLRRGKADRPRGRNLPPWRPLRAAVTAFESLAGGIRDIGISPFLVASLLVSSLILIFQTLSFWLVMLAYGLRFSPWIGAAVFLIEHLGTALPNAPSNLGTYQFFTVLGLTLFGVDKTTAAGFSIVVFIILTLPLWLIGLVAIGRRRHDPLGDPEKPRAHHRPGATQGKMRKESPWRPEESPP